MSKRKWTNMELNEAGGIRLREAGLTRQRIEMNLILKKFGLRNE